MSKQKKFHKFRIHPSPYIPRRSLRTDEVLEDEPYQFSMDDFEFTPEELQYESEELEYPQEEPSDYRNRSPIRRNVEYPGMYEDLKFKTNKLEPLFSPEELDYPSEPQEIGYQFSIDDFEFTPEELQYKSEEEYPRQEKSKKYQYKSVSPIHRNIEYPGIHRDLEFKTSKLEPLFGIENVEYGSGGLKNVEKYGSGKLKNVEKYGDKKWVNNLKILKKYIDTHKTLPSRSSIDTNIAQLSVWLKNQKRNYLYNGMISNERRRLWEEFINDPRYYIYFKK